MKRMTSGKKQRRGYGSSAKKTRVQPPETNGLPVFRESALTKSDFRYYKEDFRLDKKID